MKQELFNAIKSLINSFMGWPFWRKVLAGILVAIAIIGFILQLEDRVKGPERQKHIIKEALKEFGISPPITTEVFERQLEATEEVASQRLEVARLNFELGTEKLKNKNYEEAIGNFHKALEPLPPGTSAASAVQFNMGIAHGDLAEIKDKERNLALATDAFNNALEVYALKDDTKNRAGTLFNLGRVYLLKADMYCEKEDITQIKQSLKMADASLTESLELFRKQGMKHWEEEANKKLVAVKKLINTIEDIERRYAK